MTNYVINIDKLKIIFNNTDIELLNKSLFTIERLKDINSHQQNYLITYNQQSIFYLSHKERFRSDYSKITLLNQFLYNNSFNDILNLFIDTYNIKDFYITDLEICLNTNKQLTRNYYIHYKKNNIKLKDNYKSYSYLPSNLRFTNIVNNDTIYIKKLKSSPIQIRIENKTKEIQQHSNKHYILNYYSNKGLSITKDIYRLEITLNLIDLRRGTRYTKYQSKQDYSKIISIKEHSKLDYITQSRYDKITLFNPYKIDIEKLNDDVYLTMLINTLSPFNYERLIKPITIDKIKFENELYKTKQQRTSSLKNNDYIKEFNDIMDLFD